MEFKERFASKTSAKIVGGSDMGPDEDDDKGFWSIIFDKKYMGASEVVR